MNLRPFLRNTLFSFLLLLAFVPCVRAADEPEKADDNIGNHRVEGVDVVQGRVFRKTYRHEFTVDGGVIANNQFLLYELAQLHYTFHFRETLGFEATWGYAFNQKKDLINDLEAIPCPTSPPFFDSSGNVLTSGCGVTLDPQPDPLKQQFFGNLIWSPLYGKFSIFSKKIYHFDLFMLAGAGWYKNERSNRFAFDVGAGGKIFLNDWSAIRVELRNFTVHEDAPFSHIVNNLLGTIGVSFFLPPHPAPLWEKDKK